ncbi:MAG: DUF1501 domain-containing protein [Planctomycetes bacterium]|nr:DUF1501 domain-containing protein [Planctomycetota bacterium]
MLTIWGKAQRFCDGISRRDFVQVGALGASLTMADIMRQRAMGAVKASGSKAKAAILIYLPGGPSHMDMYDLKPEAPKEFRGEFNPIATNVPGIQISEHFPMQAKMFDKLAVVRSLVSVDEHSDSLVMTGYSENTNRTQQHPSFGSVMSKIRSADAGAQSVPPFVSLRGMSRGTEPGFLGVAHRPFTPGGPGLANLKPATANTGLNLDARKDLLTGFDDLRRDIDASGTISGIDTFTARAFDMVTSGVVREALSNEKEAAPVRERYKGVESFLTARRLVEAGVSCVTLSIGGWDTHSNNFQTLKKQLPQVDRGIANLISDLHERGMDKDVAVVMWGEFGRTPKINGSAGRDHWSPVMSALVAGGGLRMGQAVGSSTARGERPKDRPYKVSNLLATLYSAMGIDPAQTFQNGSGRPMYVLDDRDLVTELV